LGGYRFDTTDFLIKIAISQFSQTPANYTAPELKVPDSV